LPGEASAEGAVWGRIEEGCTVGPGSADAAYSGFLYDLVANTPSFTQSWDQALGETLATPMLTQIQELFNAQVTPAQFVTNVLAIKQ